MARDSGRFLEFSQRHYAKGENVVHIFWALIAAVVAAPFGHWTVTNRHNLLLSTKCSLWLRRQRVRVSCSTALRIVDRSGHYLLAQTRLRRETFGPFGGVFKYSESAREQFDSIGFEEQVTNQPATERDLRGFIQGSSVARFLRWFRGGIGRESDTECLKRELHEELSEVGLAVLDHYVDELEFEFVREVIEPPVIVENRSHMQMRIFRVFDLDTRVKAAASLREELLKSSETNDRFALATADQIRLGRAGRLIGHHAGYLFTNARVRPNEPEFES